jgi:hypothetical protein
MKSVRIVANLSIVCFLCMVSHAADTVHRRIQVESDVLITEVTGDAEYKYSGGQWILMSKGNVLKPGAIIRAPAGSKALLRMDKSFIRIAPGSEFQLVLESTI